MKKALLVLAACVSLGGIAMAQPPMGDQYQGGPARGWDRDTFWRGAPNSPRERIGFLQDRIDRGVADGSLNRGEARRASRELDRIRAMDRRMHYDSGGRLDDRDRAILQQRLDDLSRSIRWARHNDR